MTTRALEWRRGGWWWQRVGSEGAFVLANCRCLCRSGGRVAIEGFLEGADCWAKSHEGRAPARPRTSLRAPHDCPRPRRRRRGQLTPQRSIPSPASSRPASWRGCIIATGVVAWVSDERWRLLQPHPVTSPTSPRWRASTRRASRRCSAAGGGTASTRCPRPRATASTSRNGLTLVPISAQLELFCPS